MTDNRAALSEDDLAFLAEHRETALARRDAAYFRARAAYWRAWCIEGAIGLIGLFAFGWSGEALSLLLLFGFWIEWLIDVVQYRVHRVALAKAHLAEANDATFWALVKLLQGRFRQRPDTSAGPAPGIGFGFDLIFGATATALALGFISDDAMRTALSPSLVFGALGVLIALAFTLPRRFQPDALGEVSLPKFRYAQRGIGLLLIVFAAGAVGGGRWIVGVYGFFLVMGLIEGIFGARMERDAADWVRRQSAATPTRE